MALLNNYFKRNFPFTHPDELTKFFKMGLIFCTILAAYWTLGTIKESLLSDLIGSSMLPYAKIFSLLFLVPVLLLYSRLLDLLSCQKLFVLISSLYAFITLIFAYLIDSSLFNEMNSPSLMQNSHVPLYASYIFCFSFYAFVESYGSLLVALFWAIATSTTQPESAKKGFPLIVGLGQIGGILGPLVLSRIPRYFHLTTSSLSVYISALLIVISSVLFWYFLRSTPSILLQPFQGSEKKFSDTKQVPGFFEGLSLIIKNYYLIGIWCIIFFFEFITQLFDYYFKCFAAEQLSGLELAEYIGFYGSAINFVTLLCLVLGINKINNFFGIIYSLLLIPILVGFSIFGFILYQNSTILFFILVLLKAVNFSLTIPTTKQLYIPTTQDVRFKAQAWIDTFGSRTARQCSGIYAMLLNPLQFKTLQICFVSTLIQFTNYFCLSLVFFWFFIAFYLGKKHTNAIKNNTIIC